MNTQTWLPIAAGDPVHAFFVAITVIVISGVLLIVALIKYGVDGALKLWGGLGAFAGLISGGIASYYFQEQRIDEVVTEKQTLLAQKESEIELANNVAKKALGELKASELMVAELQSQPSPSGLLFGHNVGYSAEWQPVAASLDPEIPEAEALNQELQQLQFNQKLLELEAGVPEIDIKQMEVETP